MNQRKPATGRPGAKKLSDAAAAKAKKASVQQVTRASAARKTSTASTSTRPGGAGRKPVQKRKSIVNQKQTPWALIVTAAVIVAFAAAIVAVVVTNRSGNKTQTSANLSPDGQSVDAKDPYRQPALAAAMAIKGVTYRVEGSHTHVTGTVRYGQSPPIGGNHAPIWAQCTGVVYNHQLANENAVHAMEHGGVWVTYNPAKLTAAQVEALGQSVGGVDRVFVTPYAGLKTPVSLQAWGYQLFVGSSTDPRIKQFVSVLSTATANYPEQGATCTDPYFDASASTPGHPQDTEA